MASMEFLNGLSDDMKAVYLLLEDLGEASTEEVIQEAISVSSKCKDRVPSILIALEKEKKVLKRISKEKKAIVWKILAP